MSSQAAPGSKRSAWPSRGLLVALALITVIRLWAAAVIPLTEDEAYYRLWAAAPQLGYFDHPPMIAWWIALGRWLCGDTPLGVRLLPVAASLITSLAAFDLAGRLGASRAVAERAALWCQATLLIGIGGGLAVPDAATTPFWILTLCCMARTGGRREAGWWAAAGAAAGLACLSKYSALFLAPGILLWLLTAPGGARRLLRPGPWLAIAVAAAIFSVNVIWNAEHHWLTFAKQFGRVVPGPLAPRYLLELIVGQGLLLNPLICVFVLRAIGKKMAPGGPDLQLPLISAAPFALYLAVHALHDRVQAHWPVPLYPTLALCAAAAADPSQFGDRTRPLLTALRWSAAPLGLGLSALVLLHAALPASDLKGARDPVDAVRGWPHFARTVEALRVTAGAGWIGVLSYGVDGQLAAQSAISAPVVELTERERYPAADPSWRADVARTGLVVDLQRRTDPARLARCFAKVTSLGAVGRGQGLNAQDRYAVFAVSGPRLDVLRRGCPP